MKKIIYIFLIVFAASLKAWSQPVSSDTSNSIFEKTAFLKTVESSLDLFYKDYINDLTYDSIISSLNYKENEVPQFSDSVICARLSKMNEMTPFQLECNEHTLKTIRFFESKRRSFIRIALGRSELYFDMYREKLTEYGLPIELRFLSVIESALRPQIKSRAGALGLWQFMYRTGLHYGLEENSYIDERMDPEKATEAACIFLKKLYGIYGDWNLALAAYNAGPGNVNKAIRRSGNKSTYWEVRPFLPRETQGYVPNFIAAAYLMTYHAEHNIIPMEAKIHYNQLDTLCFKKSLHMQSISKLIEWDLDSLKELNPIYKTEVIPHDKKKKYCISGPFQKISLLAGVEDSLYKLEDSLYNSPIELNSNHSNSSNSQTTKNLNYYKVKSGDNLKIIANRYGVSVQNILEWNALRTTNIYVGQKLKIYSSKRSSNYSSSTTRKYYKVRSGDTLGSIARRYNTTVSSLQRLNPRVNPRRMQIGQKIRVK